MNWNKMKSNLFAISAIWSCLALTIASCQGPNRVEQAIESADSLGAEKIFVEYTVDPCLLNLLTSIVESNKQLYNNKDFFYALTFKLNSGNRWMTIQTRLWDTPGKQQYSGIIKVDSAFFLCSGDIEKDSLFTAEKRSVIKTRLKEEDPNNESYPLAEEPILKGKFLDCKEKPVFIEIYTKGKIAL